MRKRTFWLLRSNLKTLENYHSIKDLEIFEKECHDFYLLFPLQFLKDNYYDEVIIWRLSDNIIPDIIFDVNGKKFIQKWLSNFNQLFDYDPPHTTFFRGGFEEYCNITKKNPDFFGYKIYLGSSKRVTPIYGGIYDKILVESDEDLKRVRGSSIFLKTANSNIFKPTHRNKIYDLCWIANFTQIKHKGQEFFINEISKSLFLKSLKILHIGNNSCIGSELARKNNIFNIKFLGYHYRREINDFLNMCKFGIVTSNEKDGCPRVSTEILCSGTPLLIRSKSRLPNYNFENNPVVYFNDDNIENTIKNSFDNFEQLQKNSINSLIELDLDSVSRKNFNSWCNV